MIASYNVLMALPIWATALLLYILTMGVLFVLRDRCEGLFYNTSYSAVLGDGALIVAVLMAAEVLKRGVLPNGLVQVGWIHLGIIACSIGVGVCWFSLDRPAQWADRYHHLVIAPLLVYLGLTLVPVIWVAGTRVEKWSTLSLILLWAILVVYDVGTKRLDQRNYRNLGRHLNIIRHSD